MAKMKPPYVPDKPPAVWPDEELRRLLATCERPENGRAILPYNSNVSA
jgi:hypothetical protein